MNNPDEPRATEPKQSVPARSPVQEAVQQAPRKPDQEAQTVFRDWASI